MLCIQGHFPSYTVLHTTELSSLILEKAYFVLFTTVLHYSIATK